MDVEHKLDSLPVIKHTAAHLSSLKVIIQFLLSVIYSKCYQSLKDIHLICRLNISAG